MKVIKIDPWQQEITEVEVEPSLSAEREAIGADLIDIVTLNTHGDCLIVDDEGLMKEPQKFFSWNGVPSPLAGTALLVGTDMDGETVEPTLISLEDVQDAVKWLTSEQALQLARDADALAAKRQEEFSKQGISFVHVSTADIMRGMEYDGQSE